MAQLFSTSLIYRTVAIENDPFQIENNAIEKKYMKLQLDT